MKNKIVVTVSLLAFCALVAGCVNTVSGKKTAGIPWVKDRAEARYERSLDQVFNATRDVLLRNGTINSAGTIFNQTNDVRVIEGRVKQETIYVRIEALEPRLTALTIQTRTPNGGADVLMAHELDKQIALELAR